MDVSHCGAWLSLYAAHHIRLGHMEKSRRTTSVAAESKSDPKRQPPEFLLMIDKPYRGERSAYAADGRIGDDPNRRAKNDRKIFMLVLTAGETTLATVVAAAYGCWLLINLGSAVQTWRSFRSTVAIVFLLQMYISLAIELFFLILFFGSRDKFIRSTLTLTVGQLLGKYNTSEDAASFSDWINETFECCGLTQWHYEWWMDDRGWILPNLNTSYGWVPQSCCIRTAYYKNCGLARPRMRQRALDVSKSDSDAAEYAEEVEALFESGSFAATDWYGRLNNEPCPDMIIDYVAILRGASSKRFDLKELLPPSCFDVDGRILKPQLREMLARMRNVNQCPPMTIDPVSQPLLRNERPVDSKLSEICKAKDAQPAVEECIPFIELHYKDQMNLLRQRRPCFRNPIEQLQYIFDEPRMALGLVFQCADSECRGYISIMHLLAIFRDIGLKVDLEEVKRYAKRQGLFVDSDRDLCGSNEKDVAYKQLLRRLECVPPPRTPDDMCKNPPYRAPKAGDMVHDPELKSLVQFSGEPRGLSHLLLAIQKLINEKFAVIDKIYKHFDHVGHATIDKHDFGVIMKKVGLEMCEVELDSVWRLVNEAEPSANGLHKYHQVMRFFLETGNIRHHLATAERNKRLHDSNLLKMKDFRQCQNDFKKRYIDDTLALGKTASEIKYMERQKTKPSEERVNELCKKIRSFVITIWTDLRNGFLWQDPFGWGSMLRKDFRKVCEAFSFPLDSNELYELAHGLDKHNNGHVNYVDFLSRFSEGHIPPKVGQKFDIVHHKLKNLKDGSETGVREVMDRIRRICLREYKTLLAGFRAIASPTHPNFFNEKDLGDFLRKHGMDFSPDCLYHLRTAYDQHRRGCINYTDFLQQTMDVTRPLE
ncbi:EF-hand calcium-binding domain-containing protein [Echinococcus granulosus]|uniref:EF-hand calcium-binding domain-containing protein n=1 Tax=Echinococcus granulosus TaxID=6210 RepID=W6UT53_ECHGR|nr:EF-hand calcium-binding domain-containing protein [Echinococcus granulosus]EUB63886.1 EF-hand calcium-binding domain-containing protein [Echinococcus granulosus]